jgi:hypothetical protein
LNHFTVPCVITTCLSGGTHRIPPRRNRKIGSHVGQTPLANSACIRTPRLRHIAERHRPGWIARVGRRGLFSKATGIAWPIRLRTLLLHDGAILQYAGHRPYAAASARAHSKSGSRYGCTGRAITSPNQ